MFRLLPDQDHAPEPPLLLAAALTAAVLGLAAWGDAGRELLRYDRAALAAGEWWRWLSGHLVHLSWRHAFMDLAAALALGWLFGRELSPRRWAWVLLLSLLAVNAGLWWLDPGLAWYVGLSGILHGVMGAAAVTLARRRVPVGYWLLGALALKLGVEQVLGPLWLAAESAGGPVIVNSHLYGAAGGILAALVPGPGREPSIMVR
jgi:rhomboid family GlyGly-CTERM serine protease